MHRASIATGLAIALSVTWPRIARADDPPGKQEDEVGTKIDDAHERAEEESAKGAQAPARQEADVQSAPPKRTEEDDPDRMKFTLNGYVETYYQWNFERPSNGITNWRAYDDRHNTFTLQNAVLDAGFRAKDLLARLALQVGHTAASMYQSETQLPGTDGANATGPELWRYLQRASAGWAPSKPLLLEAGLFLTSYGVEGFAVKDNWNWSRTNAFARLPNYQTGLKATYHVDRSFDVIGGVYNGWNTLVDNNDEKSFSVQAQYKHEEDLTASLTYYGGVEREGGAPEGRAWRHAAQGYVQWDATRWFETAAEGDGGFEDNRFGLHWFAAAVAWVRFAATDFLYLALRGERLWEDPSANASGASRPFLLPAKFVTSETVTVDVRPAKGLSTRLEYRHDEASDDLYFAKNVQGDGTPERPYVPNAKVQNTLLFGVTAWF